MSESMIGLLMLLGIALVVSLLCHALIRRPGLAVVTAGCTTTALFNLAAYLHAGFLDPFFPIAVFVAGLYGCIVAWFVGIPFRIHRRRQKTREDSSSCRNCGYNLTGNISGICPECGRAIEPS
ncbi:MAG: hypothetical protein JSU63_07225 [Phycisphaerales bacterium]|nr:MAG: hypothetical protein JSU63_07225 [Phycisphaerales bacterium]